MLRETSDETLSPSFKQLPARLRELARERNLLVITKSNWRATVHRPGYLDYIGVKRYDAKGNVCGEHRFLGLYTSTAYSAKPADIPLLRSKVARVFERAGFPRESHAGKALANILDTYPRDELFQIGEDALLKTALAILKLEGRQRLRLFVRFDLYERFVSCLSMRRASVTRPSFVYAGRRSSSRRSTVRAPSSRCCFRSRRWCAC